MTYNNNFIFGRFNYILSFYRGFDLAFFKHLPPVHISTQLLEFIDRFSEDDIRKINYDIITIRGKLGLNHYPVGEGYK